MNAEVVRLLLNRVHNLQSKHLCPMNYDWMVIGWMFGFIRNVFVYIWIYCFHWMLKLDYSHIWLWIKIDAHVQTQTRVISLTIENYSELKALVPKTQHTRFTSVIDVVVLLVFGICSHRNGLYFILVYNPQIHNTCTIFIQNNMCDDFLFLINQ